VKSERYARLLINLYPELVGLLVCFDSALQFFFGAITDSEKKCGSSICVVIMSILIVCVFFYVGFERSCFLCWLSFK